ncbi:MAG TPA: outer membrane beta-barrel protein [Bryobacteraceae bacterium]|nr:outer membrane beta-barrel protein [Bryobacteraceae bacterium]
MRSLPILASLFLLLVPSASGQSLFSFGIKGGVPLTDAFSDTTTNAVDFVEHSFSNSKGYVIGPTAELRLPFGFFVEADALYRPLSLVTDTTLVPSPTIHYSTDISSWEFPILGKYHFLHTPLVRPYVEAGPIFRAAGSAGSYLSNKGFAMGAGVDVKLLVVHVAPEIRYSRWGGDAAGVPGVFTPPSNLNQAEFLIGLSF